MPRVCNRRLGFVRRAALIAALVAIHWLTGADLAWAKGKPAPPPDKAEKSYVMPYAVVVLGVVLGLVLVLRPVKRDDEPKKSNLPE